MRAQARRVTPLPASSLPADAFDAPAQPASGPAPVAAPQPVKDAADGLDAAWLAIAAGAVALGAGIVLARRRRRAGPARVAGAAG